MTPEWEVLVTVSAALAAGTPDRLRKALADARDGADERAVEETLVQSYLFLGYPAALNGLAVWRQVAGRPALPPLDDDTAGWSERGRRIGAEVYGRPYTRLCENVRRLHPDMERWMVDEGYGKVLGRPGLALEARELCIVAILAVLDAPRQLYSHLRGALNVGASAEEVERSLAIAAEVGGAVAAARARTVWDEVCTRFPQEG